MSKVKFGDKEYLGVADRLKQFRQENPRASIETEHTQHEDGSITFRATIVKDKSDEYSATSTGNARYSADELKDKKSFEKLETISVGRALANLGYLNNGEIATTEELEEFYEYKEKQYPERIAGAKDVKELMAIFNSMNPTHRQVFTELLSKRRKELTDGSGSGTAKPSMATSKAR